MKRLIYSIISIALLFGVASCRTADLTPESSADPITSVTAKIKIGDVYAEFTGYPVEGSNVITIEVPRFYPVESDNQTSPGVLQNAKMTAVLANNVVITEPLTIMDLTQENRITIIDQAKEVHEYIITGKLVKIDQCEILDFSIPAHNLSGIVKPGSVSILAVDEIPMTLASVTISPHAKIEPDPRVTEIDYNKPVEFKVIADNGNTNVYTVNKEIPPKRENGIRVGSEKIMFEKQLNADLGITVPNMTTGLAVSGDNLIINTTGESPMVLDKYSGEKIGMMNIDALSSVSANYYMTSDDDGNIIFCNFAPADNIFRMWVSADVNTAPVEYLSWDTGGAMYGKKLSIQGSLNTNAVISVPIIATGANSFAKWVVTDGKLESPVPELVTIEGISVWTWNCDICYAGDTPTSDYFVHGYSGQQLSWITGTTNTLKAALTATSVNFVQNAVDVIKFNKGTYLSTNLVNGATWGGADYVWLLDVSTTDSYSGGLDADHNSDSKPKSNAVLWQTYHTYGPRIIPEAPVNGNYFSDVILAPSADGYYMYMYFMFCNGYVVGVQFDCLDM